MNPSIDNKLNLVGNLFFELPIPKQLNSKIVKAIIVNFEFKFWVIPEKIPYPTPEVYSEQRQVFRVTTAHLKTIINNYKRSEFDEIWCLKEEEDKWTIWTFNWMKPINPLTLIKDIITITYKK